MPTPTSPPRGPRERARDDGRDRERTEVEAGSGRPDWRASWGRSVALLKAFRHEQSDPARFYGALADDVVGQLSGYAALDDALVVDVGGGRGFFRPAFESAGARYVVVDPDRRELLADPAPTGGAVAADGAALPLRDGSVDVCCSLNALEHVPDPWSVAEEMVRVTRPQGTVLISYTAWFGPWGGHETSPWHYLGGHRARRRYERVHGAPPKNVFGVSLFALSTGAGLRWVRDQDRRGLAEVVDVLPRYHPRWSRWVLRVPVLRELGTWNLVLVLRKR